METAQELITVVWYDHKTQQCGLDPYVNKGLLTTPGAIYRASLVVQSLPAVTYTAQYTVAYYNDDKKVAFCTLKED